MLVSGHLANKACEFTSYPYVLRSISGNLPIRFSGTTINLGKIEKCCKQICEKTLLPQGDFCTPNPLFLSQNG